MDSPAISRARLCQVMLLLSLVMALGICALAEDTWITYSSANSARRMLITSDSLFIATSGGLLIADPDSDARGRIFTNLDGLGTTDLTDIIVDASGQKWITGNGRLLKFDFNATEQFLTQDNDNNLIRLQCLADDGDQLWIGYPAGLILFNKLTDGGLIQDSYTIFGRLPASPSVSDILINGDSIWIATSSGIAVADKSDPKLLKAASSWVSFNAISNPELGSAVIRRVALFKSQLLVATSSGLFRLDRTPADTVFTELNYLITSNFMDLRIERDTLFVFSSGGMGFIVDSTVIPLTFTGLTTAPLTGSGNGIHRWVGLASGGVYMSDDTGAFVRYEYTGLPNNDVVDISIGPHGEISAAFARQPMADLIDNQWVNQSYSVGAFATKLITDESSVRWAGTFGGGLWRIRDGVPKKYDTTGTTLRGNNDPNGKNYVVISGLATDGPHLFASCFRAYDGNPIAFARLNEIETPAAWGSFGIADGIADTFIVGIDYGGGYIAAATEANGLYLCYVGPDPFDKSDDTCHYLNHDNSFLRSDNVRVVKFAPDSSLWAGTSYGLSHYDRGIDRFVDVNLPAGIGPEVTDIDFDSRGVLWVSARNGVARFDPSTSSFRTIHAINSGLVSDEVRCLALNRQTGDMWIGTNAGISLLKSPVKLTEVIDSVWTIPNPFVIDSPDDRLRVNYAFDGTVSIFDMSGAFIDDFSVKTEWRGNNRAGKPVASGVYLFVVQDAQGNTTRGKFLLVRQ